MIYTEHNDMVFAVAWSHNGRFLASGGRDRTVHIWDATSGTTHYIYTKHDGIILSLAWSPDDNAIASGDTDGMIHIWNIHTGHPSHVYRKHRRFVRTIAWSPGGEMIVSGGDHGDNTLQVWRVANGESLFTSERQHRIFAAGWSPDGMQVAAASFDHQICVWQRDHWDHPFI